jgi:hypothetical protein
MAFSFRPVTALHHAGGDLRPPMRDVHVCADVSATSFALSESLAA